jgi:tryptophan-rich sensory protein
MSTGDDKFLVIAVAAGVTIVVAVAGALLTDIGEWYFSLERPAWQPPDWAFGPVWTLVFTAAATAAVLAWLNGPGERTLVVTAFAVNAVLNIAWSWIFFRLRRPDWAFVEVIAFWLSIAALILICGRIDARAGWLLVPYLVWVSFAAFLNLTIVRLNRPFA